MAWYGWFLIGGGIGVLLLFKDILIAPSRTISGLHEQHWIQGLITAFVLGAIIPGTILWLVFG